MRLTAVIDLGSNSFRLVVYRYEPGGAWMVWDEIRAPVRLSAGMGADQVLQPEPVARALDAVRTFVAFCRQTGIDDVLATGTSALRRAVNGAEVVATFEAEGLPVRILDGREEAYYGALAILNTTTVADGFGLDMGGGSVQLMQLTGRSLRESVSLPLGAVRTTEDFLGGDDQKGGLKALRKEVRRAVAELDWFGAGDGPLAGIGGSVRNLAAAAQRLHELPNGGVQGFSLTAEMVSAVVEELAGRSVDERRALTGINPDRGDVILAAAVVLETVLATGGFAAVEITEAGLREGLFFERYYDGRDPPVPEDVGRASVENLLARHEPDAEHARRVTRHALALYDGLARECAIDAPAADRRLLEAAALLHDVGRAIGFDNRHKHARYLILDEGLPGFARGDMNDVAQIVRFIPKGTPDADTRVELLAGVLRVAEQLERTRAGGIGAVTVEAGDDRVDVLVEAGQDATVGVWAAAHSTELLAGALGREVRVLRRDRH
ncbi:MAG: Ppx/GppA family phosphatase [Solirubrobacterales bacterium]|nr:Ppx/GppA family phosphatase [Solirubrobacterales bacterium]